MARAKKPSDKTDETGVTPEDDKTAKAAEHSDAQADEPKSETSSDNVDASEDLAATPATDLDSETGLQNEESASDVAVSEPQDSDVIDTPGVPPGVSEEARTDSVTVAPPPSEPEPVAEPTPPPPPPAAPASSSGIGMGGFLALLLGGVIAGGIGWFIAQSSMPPALGPTEPFDSAGLEQSISEQSERLSSLEGQRERLQAIEDRLEAGVGDGGTFDASGLEATQGELSGRIEAVGEQVTSLQAALQALTEEVQALADRPAQVSPDGAQAMAEQLATFRAELETLTADAQAEVEAARARASEVELQAAEREALAAQETALADIRAALQSGTPYAEELGAFDDVPAELSGPAEDGVPTLAELRESFPDAARVALAETQTLPDNSGVSDRLGAFLRRQTNARSLEPRDGDDTDAVLSRSEAALGSGDLDTTLVELDTLSEPAAQALADWRNRVQLRRDALAGYDALSARFTE